MKTKILVTGVAGFVGSNLADRLIQEGYDVIGIDNLAYGVKEQIPPKVKFYKKDIRDVSIYPLFKGVDVVFHLAAKNCIADCQQDPVQTSDINVTGTVNIMEACKRAGVRKVVYAESSALYEGSKTYPTPEEAETPQSFYAQSKMAERYFVEAYCNFYGIKATALRYFCVYGPRQDYRRTIPPIMSAFIIKLLKGEQPIIYGTGKKKRDFIYVDDVNNFHLLCIKDKRTDGQTYNLGSGENYSVYDIYQLVSKMLGSKIKPIYKPNLPGESQLTLADITKAKKLGWKPQVTIEQGLQKALEYIQAHVLKTSKKPIKKSSKK